MSVCVARAQQVCVCGVRAVTLSLCACDARRYTILLHCYIDRGCGSARCTRSSKSSDALCRRPTDATRCGVDWATTLWELYRLPTYTSCDPLCFLYNAQSDVTYNTIYAIHTIHTDRIRSISRCARSCNSWNLSKVSFLSSSSEGTIPLTRKSSSPCS